MTANSPMYSQKSNFMRELIVFVGIVEVVTFVFLFFRNLLENYEVLPHSDAIYGLIFFMPRNALYGFIVFGFYWIIVGAFEKPVFHGRFLSLLLATIYPLLKLMWWSFDHVPFNLLHANQLLSQVGIFLSEIVIPIAIVLAIGSIWNYLRHLQKNENLII